MSHDSGSGVSVCHPGTPLGIQSTIHRFYQNHGVTSLGFSSFSRRRSPGRTRGTKRPVSCVLTENTCLHRGSFSRSTLTESRSCSPEEVPSSTVTPSGPKGLGLFLWYPSRCPSFIVGVVPSTSHSEVATPPEVVGCFCRVTLFPGSLVALSLSSLMSATSGKGW